MKVLVTGSDGFIGKNLCLKLQELQLQTLKINRKTSIEQAENFFSTADVVIHLAGVNRPNSDSEFDVGNLGLTSEICALMESLARPVPVIFASSTQAELDNPYGRSKRAAEQALHQFGLRNSVSTLTLRLPNVFGKWSRPNYNSAIATFCHAVANGLPYKINDPSAPLRLAYIDDVVDCLVASARALLDSKRLPALEPVYETTVGEVASILEDFKDANTSLNVGEVGAGLRRALYSTYVSFLPREKFVSQLKLHTDARGDFVEMLRTPNAGQFSYFTAHPGVTRGGHYHHTKTEKFLVISGDARFRFRNVLSNETFQIFVKGGEGKVVDTIPGWAHDISNIGFDTLVVMLWANENFDRAKPDTIAAEV